MNGKVRFVVTATYYNIIDQWYFDTVEKAREKYSELLVTRPKWEIRAERERESLNDSKYYKQIGY